VEKLPTNSENFEKSLNGYAPLCGVFIFQNSLEFSISVTALRKRRPSVALADDVILSGWYWPDPKSLIHIHTTTFGQRYFVVFSILCCLLYLFVCGFVNYVKHGRTTMWANAQRDGRPAEYRWRRLFNATKLGRRPLPECRAVTLPRRETCWN